MVDDEAIGCVAYRILGGGVAEAERLAVVPKHRGGRTANLLCGAILARAREDGLDTIRISIVSQHQALRRWYIRMGFAEQETREFEYLPFQLQYLEYQL